MNLDQINEGLRLEEMRNYGPAEEYNLVQFLKDHARELLECARRCGEMEKEIERLKEFEWKYKDLCK